MKLDIKVNETEDKIEVYANQIFKATVCQHKPECFTHGATREDVIEWNTTDLLNELTEEHLGRARDLVCELMQLIDKDFYSEGSAITDELLTILKFTAKDVEGE